jgi:hypothetical protein
MACQIWRTPAFIKLLCGAKMVAIILINLDMFSICYYTFDSYNELKKVADDKDVLCDTYADWMVEFTKAVNGLKEQGMEVVPVSISIEQLQKWCNRNKLKNTSSSRSKYVAEIASLSHPCMNFN